MKKYNAIATAAIADHLHEVSEEYKAKTLSLISEADRKPTWDGRRFHAPCDNYDFDGRSYAAGEFLHDPDIGGTGVVKSKVLIDASLLEVIGETLSHYSIHCSNGKIWSENDGSNSCYLYIEGPGRYVNAVSRLAPINDERVLVEAGEEGTNTGKTWETTLGRIKTKYFLFTPFEVLTSSPVSENLYGKVLDWELKPKGKRKAVKVTVGFHYPKKSRIESDGAS